MAIKETIVLNFQTQLDQAKTDILSLADLYKKSMVAPGQEGAPSSAQRFDVEQLVSERAMEYGVSPDEMKAVLADINTILQEEAEIRNRLQELKDKSLATEAKIKLQEEEKNKLIAEGAEALNLKKTASLQEVTAAKKSLDAQIATGNATKQQLEQHQKVSAIFDQLSTKNRSIGQLISHNLKLNKEQTVLLEQQDDAFSRLRRSALQLNITEDERENIERLLVPSIMDQTNETKALEKAQKRVVKAAKENAAAQEDINNSLRNAPKTFAEKATSAFLYFQAVQAIRRVVRAAVRTLTELDRALTDIAIVTNMSREQTQGLIGTYQEMAKRVGLTTTEVVNLSTAFFRQGRAAADALALTETAAKFARIAAINVNDAANFLTAAINGFNLAASEATRIIDRFAALGASAAASAQEIAIALSKVAPAAASAGVEIDNLMAFVTKAIETTREAPENIGTAFKTIFARMRELSDIGKVMEDGMDVNRVESALKNIGVDLRDASGEFRDLDRVLIEVGHKWDSITRSQQAYVATTLAGTRQQTRLIALFENFDRTLELIDISQRSAGAAAIQHAEFMKGLEAATTNLKTSFQEFITSIASSDQMLFVIDSLRVGIDLLNTVFGKLILTGLAYKALMKGVGIEGSKLKAVKDFLAGSMSKLTTAFGTNTVAVYKSNLAQQKAELASRTAGVAMGKQVAVQEFGRQAALKNALANSKLGLSFASLKKSILAKKLALSTSTIAMQWQTASAAKAQGVLTGLQAAQFKTAIAAQAMGKAFVAAGTKILVIMSKLLLSPLGLVVAIGGIILALKKMADATDTVNPTVAEWQIRIKKANEALKNIIKAIKDFFTNLMTGNGIAARFFQFFLNGWKRIFRLLGRLPVIGKMFQALTGDLTDLEKAAAGIVVLTNRIKDLNKEMRETQKTTQQLSSALERFERLNRQRFRSARETQEMLELQADLQRRLETTAVGFDLVVQAKSAIRENEQEILGLTNQIRTLVQTELDKNSFVSFEDLLNTDVLTDEMKANIPLIMEVYASTLIEGFDDLAPEVQRALLRMLQIDPDGFREAANKTLTAFEDTVIEIKTISAPVSVETVVGTGVTALTNEEIERLTGTPGQATELPDQRTVITTGFNIIAGETAEEAFERAVGEGFTGTIEDFMRAAQGVFRTTSIDADSFFGSEGLIAQIATQAARISDIASVEEFTDFLDEIRSIDLSGLSEGQLENLRAEQSEFFSLLELPDTDLGIENLFARGGIRLVREFSMFSDQLGRRIDRLRETAREKLSEEEINLLDIFSDVVAYIPDTDPFGNVIGEGVTAVVVKTGQQVQEEFINAITTAMMEAEDPIEELLTFIREGFEGVSGDIISSLNFDRLFIDEFDFEAINRRVFDSIEDTQKILDLAQKDVAQLSADELTFLATRYPEILAQFRDGTFNALNFERQARAQRAQWIAAERDAIQERYNFERNELTDLLGLNRDVSDVTLASELEKAVLAGIITEGQKRQWEWRQLNTAESIAELESVAAVAMAERDITEQIRKRYKAQLDLITAQKDAIKDAQKMKELQDQSAEVARRSMQATRIGAVGSVEARFNQQQLNREIEQMNRSLQDQLQTAQLEAQQKILEDSQQKALQSATVNLTNATVDLNEILTDHVIPHLEDLIDENHTPSAPSSSGDRGPRNPVLDALNQFAIESS